MFFRTFKVALCLMLISVGIAHANLDAYIEDLNVSVKGDIGGYKAKLGARFGASESQIKVVFRSVESPAEAAIVFWLGEKSGQSLDSVLQVYRSQKSKGWGSMAKSLGIKPGTPAFHALKKGNIQLSLNDIVGNGKGKGKNKKTKRKKKKHG